MKKVLFFAVLCLFLVGCAALKQGINDYQVGKNTELVNGEISPAQQAQEITNTVAALPVVGPFAGTLGLALTGLFTYLRGRRIRLANGVVTNTPPATGFLGSSMGLEAIIQTVSNIATGAFEVGPDGSPLKRAWKVGLASILGLAGVAVTIPAVQQAIIAHPSIALAVGGGSALFGGIEKALSTVKPVVTPVTTVTVNPEVTTS